MLLVELQAKQWQVRQLRTALSPARLAIQIRVLKEWWDINKEALSLMWTTGKIAKLPPL